MAHKTPIKFFTGTSSRYLAEKMANSFGQALGKSSLTVFSDGEFQPSYEESVRGSIVFIVQSTFPPSDNLFELLFTKQMLLFFYFVIVIDRIYL